MLRVYRVELREELERVGFTVESHHWILVLMLMEGLSPESAEISSPSVL